LRVNEVRTLDELYSAQAFGNYVGGFALVAGTLSVLLLAAAGTYALMSFTVNDRRREIGVRVALGATPRSVLGLVVGQGMTLAIIGVVAGVAGALVLTRVMAAVLYEVRATDPATFAIVVLVLLATAFVASWLPAQRALRIDPVQALRYD
jgi:ABC-type antimicrobial peptide transport system permease subunit